MYRPTSEEIAVTDPLDELSKASRQFHMFRSFLREAFGNEELDSPQTLEARSMDRAVNDQRQHLLGGSQAKDY